MTRAWILACLLCGGLTMSMPLSAQTTAAPTPLRVLVVGNSLVYVNNLPALLSALAPTEAPLVADMLVAPGGDLAERWQDGASAREIASGQWQVLVLQERGGLLACLEKPTQRDEPACRGSVTAHRKLAELAKARGMRVILLGTWGPDAIWQKQLSRSLRKLATQIGAEPFDAGADLRAFAQSHPGVAIYQDESLHPSLDGSLRIAGGLYRLLTGREPATRALTITAPLYPVRIRPDPLQRASLQPALAGKGTATTISAEQLTPLLAADSN